MRLRLRLRWRRTAFALAAFLFALLALLPLRVALGTFGVAQAGLAAEEAVGTVWFGVLKDARLGSAGLGDVATRLRLFPLFLGRARFDLKRIEGEGKLEGAVTVSRHGFGIDDASGTVPVAPIAAVPAGTLELNDVSLRFEDGLCRAAEGRVTARLLTAAAATVAGEARCEGAMLLLPLAGATGGDRLTMRIGADGRYRGEAALGGIVIPFEGSF